MTAPSRKVYVIRSQVGHVKIGIATNPRARLRGFQTASATKLDLAHVYEPADGLSAKTIERAAHSLLAAAHEHGEWFSADINDAISAIEAAVELVRDGAFDPRPRLPGSGPGRPKTTGRGLLVGIRLHEPMISAIDRFISDDRRSLSRPEAIRELLKATLVSLGLLGPQ